MSEKLPFMKIIRRQDSIYFYVTHPDKYNSSFQMLHDGPWGHIYTLNGEAFFGIAESKIDAVYLEAKVKLITFSMMDDTLKILRYKLRRKCTFKVLFRYADDDGRFFNMVLMKQKGDRDVGSKV